MPKTLMANTLQRLSILTRLFSRHFYGYLKIIYLDRVEVLIRLAGITFSNFINLLYLFMYKLMLTLAKSNSARP